MEALLRLLGWLGVVMAASFATALLVAVVFSH
jgi:hypothetical protein